MGAKPQVDNVGMGRFDLSYETCTATIRWHLSEIFSKSSANMGQSTSLDFLARISCHHFSLWMHCLFFGDQKVRHRLGRGVSVELVAIYIFIYIHIVI